MHFCRSGADSDRIPGSNLTLPLITVSGWKTNLSKSAAGKETDGENERLAANSPLPSALAQPGKLQPHTVEVPRILSFRLRSRPFRDHPPNAGKLSPAPVAELMLIPVGVIRPANGLSQRLRVPYDRWVLKPTLAASTEKKAQQRLKPLFLEPPATHQKGAPVCS